MTTSRAAKRSTHVNGMGAPERACHMPAATHSRRICEAIRERNLSIAIYPVRFLNLHFNNRQLLIRIECDRAFTRSDALAKHMRTVHETEALRPSDPVPKSMQTQSGPKSGKLKIILKTQQSHAAGQDDAVDDGDMGSDIADFFTPLTEQHGFTSKELAMEIKLLFNSCVAHLKWESREGEVLKQQAKEMEEAYRQEWLEKETLLNQVIQVEENWWQRRKLVVQAEAEAIMAKSVEASVPLGDNQDAVNGSQVTGASFSQLTD